MANERGIHLYNIEKSLSFYFTLVKRREEGIPILLIGGENDGTCPVVSALVYTL